MALGKRDKMLLGVLAGMALAAGSYFAFDWYVKTHAALVNQRDALASELNQVMEKVRNMASIKQELAEARQLQEDLEQKVPADEEVPQLLRDLANMLNLAGVELKSFRPGRPAPSVLPEWSQIKVTISVSGTYRELTTMFSNLQKARRLYGVASFSINGGGVEADPVLTCNMDLLVYCTNRS